MEECTQVIDITDNGFDISELGRVKVGRMIVNETSYDIYKGENVIGRDELSDIVLRSYSISSKHAVVEVEDWDTHLIFDCGSTNKTRLGNMFLKPHVRYNLQGCEEIMFADLKAKYFKLDKPEKDQVDEDKVSDAGSESILDSESIGQIADPVIQIADKMNENKTSLQAQHTHAENDNQDVSFMFSDLNDSSLLEENKQKVSSSKLQVVDASDDSTDDEVDFIPPSQTVKEFASKKQLALKGKCLKESSETVTAENEILNEDNIFMSETPVYCNKLSNSLNLNTQSYFSSEVQEPVSPKGKVIYDKTIFEAETQSEDSRDLVIEKHENNRVSSDIFDLETEVPEISFPGEDVNMSNLELSKAFTESSELALNSGKLRKVEHDNKNTTKNSLCIITKSDTQINITHNIQSNDCASAIISKVTANNDHISKVTEEIQDSISIKMRSVSNISEQAKDVSDIMTQPNPSFNSKHKTSISSEDLENEPISDICTQVNTFLKVEPLKSLVKEEIHIKDELDASILDNFNFSAEETHLNIKLNEKNKTRKCQKLSKDGQAKSDEENTNILGEETQPNLLLYSFLSGNEMKVEGDIRNLSFQTLSKQNKTTEKEDSDDTDVEDGNNQRLQVEFSKFTAGADQRKARNVYDPTIKTFVPDSKNDLEIDDNSNESDSLLATVEINSELLEQQLQVPSNQNLVKENENSGNKVNPSCNLVEESSKQNRPDITLGDMDICSTVGDGTYLSTCSSSKVGNHLPNSCQKISSKSKHFTFEQKKGETESLDQSLAFNKPCGSSTPFRTEERVMLNNMKSNKVQKTPPRKVINHSIESPELPCTEELMEIACKTPERNEAVSESINRTENLPLALKRTPRARKLSRKVAETIVDKDSKYVILPTLVSQIKNINTTDNDNHTSGCRENVQDFKQSKKKIAKRKSPQQQNCSTGTEIHEKTRDITDDVILKQKFCVSKLSVNLIDIAMSKSEKADTKESDIKKHSPNKRAKQLYNVGTTENRIEKDKPALKRRPTDKKQNENIERMLRKSPRKFQSNPNPNKNMEFCETQPKNSLNSSSITNAKVEKLNNSCEVNASEEKINTEILSNQHPSKEYENFGEKSILVGKQFQSPPTKTEFASGSSTQSKTKNLKNKNKKPNDSLTKMLIDMEVTSNDKNYEYGVPIKRTKIIENPYDAHRKMAKRTHSSVNKYQKSVEVAVEVNTKGNSDSENIDTSRKHTSNDKKEIRAKRAIKKHVTDAPSEHFDHKTSEGSIRRSSRRMKSAVVNPSSERELLDVGNTLAAVKTESKPESKNNLKEKVVEIPEAKTIKNNRKTRGKAGKSDIENDIGEPECQKEMVSETCNNINKTKTQERLLDVSIKGTSTAKSARENGDANTSNLGDGEVKLLTKCRKPSRPKVKPARYREKSENSDSDSSSIGTNTSRNKRQNNLSSIDSVSSKNNRGSHSNEETSTFVAPSSLCDIKKQSDIFKTPVCENRRSRTSGIERSRSRSNSNQSSFQSDSSALQSPRRLGAKGKHILFTSGLINATWESYVRKLGGSVVDCPVECSLLVADKVRRTVKFLCVLGQGKPIVSPDWLIQSWRCTSFIEPMDYLLIDKEAEGKFKFSLSQTIQAAKDQPLLNGFHIHASLNVKPPPEDMKSIVESCGGQYLDKVPSKWPPNSIVISHVDDKAAWKKFKIKGHTPPIVSAEMLLIGVLQHKLEIEPHRLS